MRRTVSILLALAPFAAGCEEEYEAPRSPADVVQSTEVGYARGPAVPPQVVYVQGPVSVPPPNGDPVWQAPTYYVPPPSAEYYVAPPHPIPRHTISLGYIGDWPLASGEVSMASDPRPPSNSRPFPSAWERDFHYGHGYVYGSRYRGGWYGRYHYYGR